MGPVFTHIILSIALIPTSHINCRLPHSLRAHTTHFLTNNTARALYQHNIHSCPSCRPHIHLSLKPNTSQWTLQEAHTWTMASPQLHLLAFARRTVVLSRCSHRDEKIYNPRMPRLFRATRMAQFKAYGSMINSLGSCIG